MRWITNLVIGIGILIVIPALVLGFLFDLYRSAFIYGMEYNRSFWDAIKKIREQDKIKYRY